jgi:hypothetical protein
MAAVKLQLGSRGSEVFKNGKNQSDWKQDEMPVFRQSVHQLRDLQREAF